MNLSRRNPRKNREKPLCDLCGLLFKIKKHVAKKLRVYRTLNIEHSTSNVESPMLDVER